MIIDSSALLAILFAEDDAAVFAEAIERADVKRLSAASWLETAIRIDSAASPVASNAFDDLIREAAIQIEPVSVEQAAMARAAYRAYGRGSRHAAKLNFGDCFSHALAKDTGEPLLFKGNDFAATDLSSAL